MPSARRLLIAISITFYLLLVLGVFTFIWHRTGGHFTYSLDDPYIHMAVARQIAGGHYGINPGEVSSPSSSILWPLLLAPVASHLYAPLLLNFLAGLLSAALLGLAVSEWPLAPGHDSLPRRILSVLALTLSGNLLGTTFLGMEHGLQVFLAISCAFGICRVLNRRPMPMGCIVAAAIAPLVRYEDLALTLAVAAALVGTRRTRVAITLVLAAILPLIAFSAYLHSQGLPLLPVSVLVKGKAVQAHANPIITILRLMASGTFHALTDPSRWPLLLLLAALTTAAWREPQRPQRFALAGASVAIALHLLFGRFGWFHRYEVYALVFALLIVLRLLHAQPPIIPLVWYALGLVAIVTPYVQAISESALSAEDVYGQQFQMARFTSGFYRGNVAVNDLGLVSDTIGPGRYVLDLGGLASLETARQPVKSAAWLRSITQRHHIGLTMIYPGLLEVPKEWPHLGAICLRRPPVALGGPCVDFYASDPAQQPALQQAFTAFSATLPPQTFSVPAPGEVPSTEK